MGLNFIHGVGFTAFGVDLLFISVISLPAFGVNFVPVPFKAPFLSCYIPLSDFLGSRSLFNGIHFNNDIKHPLDSGIIELSRGINRYVMSVSLLRKPQWLVGPLAS